LSDAIAVCQRAVSPHSTIQELEGLLIDAKNNEIKITGYNLEIGIQSSIVANVEREGTVVLNSRIFGDYIRKLPDDIVNIEVDEKNVANITCQRSKFVVAAILPDGFPEIPKVDGEMGLNIPQAMLKSMIRNTIYAVSTNENRPIHTGSLFEMKDGVFNVVSVDGYRLALRKEKVDGQDNSFVVPSKALSEVMRILKEDEESKLSIVLTKKHISFEIDNCLIVSRLLEGDFLNYEGSIPKNASIFVKIKVRPFIDCVERASLIISEKMKSPIKLIFADNEMHLSCASVVGTVDENLDVESTGDEIEIGFNNRYLLDALKACEEEEVILEMTSPLSPCVIRPIDSDKFTFLVLPVRLKNG